MCLQIEQHLSAVKQHHLFYAWLLLKSQSNHKLNCAHYLENILSLKHIVTVLAVLHILIIWFWFWCLSSRRMFLNHCSHSCFAVQMYLGCCFMRTCFWGVGHVVSYRLGLLSKVLCQSYWKAVLSSSVIEWTKNNLCSPPELSVPPCSLARWVSF